MPRNEKDLTLKLADVKSNVSRPTSSPIALQGIDLSSMEGSFPLSSLPPLPASPPPPGKTEHNKTIDRTMLDLTPRTQPGQSKEEDDRPNSSMSKIYHLRQIPGSTPELSLVDNAVKVPFDDKTDLSTSLPSGVEAEKRKDKTFRNPLTRSKSIRKDSHSSSMPNGLPVDFPPPRTPPTAHDRALPERPTANMLTVKTKDKRGKSSDRSNRSASDDNIHSAEPARKNAFLIGSKNALSKAKTGGGNFLTRIGKIGRSGSSHEKETHVPEEAYVIRNINKPLVEQTRITRISKSLDACKDKTEYWMPSLPWRCIDYLNLNCESEGLYRIPGSGPQIKQWQRRFDTELDIDLLDETELYDPNNISSLLKTWLRELPTEIFPMDIQKALATELAKDNPDYANVGQPAPQKLRDTLSELSPFNYYLLFAITCHLSLLVSHHDKNRMDLHNLFICIGPCLYIDRWAFNYLVGDWRNCWQGCWTEKQTLEAERRYEDPDYVGDEHAVVSSAASPQAERADLTASSFRQQQAADDDRAVSSGGESMLSVPVFEDALERPGTSSSTRRLASRDNSKTRSASATRHA